MVTTSPSLLPSNPFAIGESLEILPARDMLPSFQQWSTFPLPHLEVPERRQFSQWSPHPYLPSMNR